MSKKANGTNKNASNCDKHQQPQNQAQAQQNAQNNAQNCDKPGKKAAK